MAVLRIVIAPQRNACNLGNNMALNDASNVSFELQLKTELGLLRASLVCFNHLVTAVVD